MVTSAEIDAHITLFSAAGTIFSTSSEMSRAGIRGGGGDGGTGSGGDGGGHGGFGA